MVDGNLFGMSHEAQYTEYHKPGEHTSTTVDHRHQDRISVTIKSIRSNSNYSRGWIIWPSLIRTILCCPIDFDVWIIHTFYLIRTIFCVLFLRIIRAPL